MTLPSYPPATVTALPSRQQLHQQSQNRQLSADKLSGVHVVPPSHLARSSSLNKGYASSFFVTRDSLAFFNFPENSPTLDLLQFGAPEQRPLITASEETTAPFEEAQQEPPASAEQDVGGNTGLETIERWIQDADLEDVRAEPKLDEIEILDDIVESEEEQQREELEFLERKRDSLIGEDEDNEQDCDYYDPVEEGEVSSPMLEEALGHYHPAVGTEMAEEFGYSAVEAVDFSESYYYQNPEEKGFYHQYRYEEQQPVIFSSSNDININNYNNQRDDHKIIEDEYNTSRLEESASDRKLPRNHKLISLDFSLHGHEDSAIMRRLHKADLGALGHHPTKEQAAIERKTARAREIQERKTAAASRPKKANPVNRLANWSSSFAHVYLGSRTEDFVKKSSALLPRLSSAVIGLQYQLSGKSAAGAWQDSLLEKLWWKHNDWRTFDRSNPANGNAALVQRLLLAPSWSWDSVDGAVSFLGSHKHPRDPDLAWLSNFVDVSSPASRHTIGLTSTGILRLYGPMCDLLVIERLTRDIIVPAIPNAATNAGYLNHHPGTNLPIVEETIPNECRYSANLWGGTFRIITIYPDEALTPALVECNTIARSGGPLPISAAADSDRLYLIPLFAQARQKRSRPLTPSDEWVLEISGLVLRRKRGVAERGFPSSSPAIDGVGGVENPERPIIKIKPKFTRVAAFTARTIEMHESPKKLDEVIKWFEKIEKRSVEIV